MVREVNRLRALQVCVAGDDDTVVRLPKRDERLLQRAQFQLQLDDLVAKPHPHVERDLVVARAAGVQLGPGRLAPGQLGLKVHVDVLKRLVPLKPAGLDIVADGLERTDDALGLGLGEHTDAPKHGGVGDGAHEVMPPQPAVERDRLGELSHVPTRPTAEPAAPRHW